MYILCLVIPSIAYSQFNRSSKFLYGRSRSQLPYYIHLQGGANSGITLFNKDFENRGAAPSIALAFEKPLGYRPSLYLHFRFLGNYGQWNNVLGYASQLSNAYDFSLNYSYMLYDWYGWQYRASLGIGSLSNQYEIKGPLGNFNEKNSSVITPLQISTGRVLKNRWELEIGYRYYIAWDDNIEGLVNKNKYDKYGFTFVGIKYLLGEKDYRFQRKDSCPTVE